MHNPACDKNDSHNHTQPSVWFIIELQLILEDMSSNIYKHMPVIGDTNQYRQPPMEILLDVYTVDQIYSTRRIAPSTTKSQKKKYRFLRQQETVKIMYQQPHAPTNFGHERDVNTKICTQMSHTTWLNHVQQHPQNTTFDITYEIGSDDARGEERPSQLRNTPTPQPTQHPTPNPNPPKTPTPTNQHTQKPVEPYKTRYRLQEKRLSLQTGNTTQRRTHLIMQKLVRSLMAKGGSTQRILRKPPTTHNHLLWTTKRWIWQGS